MSDSEAVSPAMDGRTVSVNAIKRQKLGVRKDEGRANRNSMRSMALFNEAFSQLLDEKPLGEINVTMISRRADLARNTFYAHYASTDELLREFVGEAVTVVQGDFEELSPVINPAIPETFVRALFDKVEEHREILRSHVFVKNVNNRRRLTAIVRYSVVPTLTRMLSSVDPGNEACVEQYLDFVAALTIELVNDYLNDVFAIEGMDFSDRVSLMYRAAYRVYLEPRQWGADHAKVGAAGGSELP